MEWYLFTGPLAEGWNYSWSGIAVLGASLSALAPPLGLAARDALHVALASWS